jgi:hypothetical protein
MLVADIPMLWWGWGKNYVLKGHLYGSPTLLLLVETWKTRRAQSFT